MGPSGTSILLVIVAIAVGLWLYCKPPARSAPQALQRYAGFESNMETVVLRNCTPPGCAAVYLTPTVGRASPRTLPRRAHARGQLEQQGIECFIVLGEEPVKDAVKRARGIRRPGRLRPARRVGEGIGNREGALLDRVAHGRERSA